MVNKEFTFQLNKNRRPTYDCRFLDWMREHSREFSGYAGIGKYLGCMGNTVHRICKEENIKLEFTPNKFQSKFDAPYKHREWLYQKVIVEGKTFEEIASEIGCTVRVIQKWTEKLRVLAADRRVLLHISPEQERLILPSLLGDGHISHNNNQFMFIVSHSKKQKDYLWYKYKILENLCSQEPTYYPPKEKLFEANTKRYLCSGFYRFGTRILDDLEKFLLMDKADIINGIDEYQLCIYLLDDAYRGSSSWELCYASFSDEEKKLFQKKCQDFGLKGKQESDERYFRFTANSSRIIDQMILKNIPNTLDIVQYKIINRKRKGKNIPVFNEDFGEEIENVL